MPIYEYKCTECGHELEELQSMNSRPLRSCPECKGKLQRMHSAPAFQFKGSGWYVTDYAKSGKAEKGSEKGSETSGEKSDGAKGKSEASGSGSKGSGGKKKAKAAK